MADKQQITILSPLDLVPGAIDPDGRVVETARISYSRRDVIAYVEFEDGTTSAYLWPNGSGWTVNGRTAP